MRDAPAGKVFFFIIQKDHSPVKNGDGIARLFSTIFTFLKRDDFLDADATQILFSVTADVMRLLFFVILKIIKKSFFVISAIVRLLFSVVSEMREFHNGIGVCFFVPRLSHKKAPLTGACLFYLPSARAMRSLSKPTISSSPMMITGTPI